MEAYGDFQSLAHKEKEREIEAFFFMLKKKFPCMYFLMENKEAQRREINCIVLKKTNKRKK